MRQGLGGGVLIELFITPDGKNDHCKMVKTTGNKEINETVCQIAMSRFKYVAARDSEGQPTFGVISRKAIFMLPNGMREIKMPVVPDVFGVEALPGKKDPFLTLDVVIDVDRDGKLMNCALPAETTERQLGRVACVQLRALWEPRQEQENAGALAYVRSLQVGFVVTGPQPAK